MKVCVGDVFVVPTGDGRAGIGQVVGYYGSDAYFLAIFGLALPFDDATDQVEAALSAPVLLIALSLDAKLNAGQWPIVSRAPVDSAIPLPAYKEAVREPSRVVSSTIRESGGDQRPPRRLPCCRTGKLWRLFGLSGHCEPHWDSSLGWTCLTSSR